MKHKYVELTAMANFIKKYWLAILLFAVFTVLIWLIIPYQERNYLQPDIDKIKEKSNVVLIWTELILFGSTFIYLFIKNLRSLEKMVVITFNVIMLSLAAFLSFNLIFLSATLFLNGFSKGETIDKKYSVAYINDDKNNLLLWDMNANIAIQSNGIILPDDIKKLKLKDTVIVSFKKGLLGFNSEPRVKIK